MWIRCCCTCRCTLGYRNNIYIIYIIYIIAIPRALVTMTRECGVASPAVAKFARCYVVTGGATTGIANATFGGGEATCAGGRVVGTDTQPSAGGSRRVAAGLVGRPWIRVRAPS